MHACIRASVHPCMYAFMLAYMHTHTHIYIYIFIIPSNHQPRIETTYIFSKKIQVMRRNGCFNVLELRKEQCILPRLYIVPIFWNGYQPISTHFLKDLYHYVIMSGFPSQDGSTYPFIHGPADFLQKSPRSRHLNILSLTYPYIMTRRCYKPSRVSIRRGRYASNFSAPIIQMYVHFSMTFGSNYHGIPMKISMDITINIH